MVRYARNHYQISISIDNSRKKKEVVGYVFWIKNDNYESREKLVHHDQNLSIRIQSYFSLYDCWDVQCSICIGCMPNQVLYLRYFNFILVFLKLCLKILLAELFIFQNCDSLVITCIISAYLFNIIKFSHCHW